MVPELEPELRHLYQVLLGFPDGVGEYALMEKLRGPSPFRELDELGMFRVHFLLFHHLYRLRGALERQRQGTMDIHCTEIRLRFGWSSNPADAALSTPDPLADYYLDLSQLTNTTEQELMQMLGAFWTRFGAWAHQDDALSVLGLALGATQEEIRARYHALCLEHHPDRGGDAREFARVAAAMESLRSR